MFMSLRFGEHPFIERFTISFISVTYSFHSLIIDSSVITFIFSDLCLGQIPFFSFKQIGLEPGFT